jgi:hypothetical protein
LRQERRVTPCPAREVLAENRTSRSPPPNCKHRPMVENVYLTHRICAKLNAADVTRPYWSRAFGYL